jgi:hypothetical protein
MFKLVVLSCLVSVAFGGLISAPYSVAQIKSVVEPQYSIVETPTVNHVASVVKSVPTAYSHQSQTQYHSKSVVEPIYAHGVQKSYISTPIVKSVVEQVPVVAKAVYAEPIVAAKSYYAEPYVAKSYYAEPIVAAKSYQYAAAPLAYSAPVYAQKSLSYASLPASYASYSSLPYASYAPYAHQW